MSHPQLQTTCKLKYYPLSTDPDGDSQMRSSSSSDEADSENMFPAELDPPGTVDRNRFGDLLSPSSEATPPQSQEPDEVMTAAGEQHRAASSEPVGNGGWVPQSDFAKSAAGVTFQPGAAWNTKKAREEYERALMQIEDRNFSLSTVE